MFKWYTCSIDFAYAFVQASLKEPVWIHLPRGFRSRSGGKTCLKLLKSLDGLAEAPRLWYLHLFKALLADGFLHSALDPCLLMKEDIIIIFYVDDAGIMAKNKGIVDAFLDRLIAQGFDLTREGSFSAFLGIQYEERVDGTISLTQKGLITKIIEATQMADCNPNWTPALKTALGMDPDGLPMKETWSYRTVVGNKIGLRSD